MITESHRGIGCGCWTAIIAMGYVGISGYIGWNNWPWLQEHYLGQKPDLPLTATPTLEVQAVLLKNKDIFPSASSTPTPLPELEFVHQGDTILVCQSLSRRLTIANETAEGKQVTIFWRDHTTQTVISCGGVLTENKACGTNDIQSAHLTDACWVQP